MSTAAPQYPFDPTGQATSNKITGERQTISPPDWTDYYFICPTATPYFAASLVMTLVATGRQLVEGVDYNPTHKFYDASIQCATPVYGSITFLDKTLSGVIEMSYQTLGGDWTLNSEAIATVLANTLMDPRLTTWEEVVNLPYQFPPVAHAWDIVDMVGAKDIVAALDNMVTALLQSGDQGLAAHLADFGNPHHVTAAQVGLGNVQNYPIGTTADAISGSSNVLYMTPALTQSEIAQFALIPLNAHIANTTNPHNVTATQVGLSAVQNYGIASTAQAQAGTVNNVYMTPALVAAAITTQAIAPLNTHLADYNNPHQVTATQVGLSNVPNYPMATTAQAQAGTATDCFMSPALVTAVMQTGAGGNLQAHINDHNNPHEVTATQVGLGNVQNFGLATNAQALAGTDNASYMTPLLVSAAITDATAPFAAHLTDTSNPHAVTATQVGLGNVQNYAMASTDDASEGTVSTAYMSPLLTAAAIAAQALAPLNTHIDDTDNPHQVTAAQVGAPTTDDMAAAIDALSTVYLAVDGTAADSDKLGGQALTDVIAAAAAAAELVLTYPGTSLANPYCWTPVCVMSIVAAESTDPYPAPLVFEVAGGEPSRGSSDSAAFRIVGNAQDPNGLEITRLAGYSSSVALGTVYDSTAQTLTIYVRSDGARNPIVLRFFSDPGASFPSSPTVYVVEPTDIVYLTQLRDVSEKAYSSQSVAGQVEWGLPYGSARLPTAKDNDTLVQRINVIDDGDDVSTVNALAQDWGHSWANGIRMSSYAHQAYRADSLLGWAWDATNSAVTYSRTPTGLSSLLSETKLPASATIEVLVSSTDLSDMALGLVAAFTDDYGQPATLHVLRDCGGLTTLASTYGAVPGEGTYGLFTIGYNLLQNDGLVLINTNENLTWGDSVADADRATAGAYVPQSQTSGTNGWNGKGAVAVKVVIAGTTLTISTSDFGATAGSITYVNTQTLDLTQYAGHAGVAALIDAITEGGVRWGLATFQVPSVSYAVQSAPEMYQRYIVRSEDANSNETSTLYCHDGSAWVNFSLVDQVMVKPGRLYYSAVNSRLFHALRDGTLEPIQLVAYTPDGAAILTT